MAPFEKLMMRRQRDRLARYRAESNSRTLHRDAFIADLQAHPGIKVSVFNRKLTPGIPLWIWVLNQIAPLDPLGFNPLTLRTSFFDLQLGGVDLLFATAVVPEEEFLSDTRFKIRGLRGTLFLIIVGVLNIFFIDAPIMSVVRLVSLLAASVVFFIPVSFSLREVIPLIRLIRPAAVRQLYALDYFSATKEMMQQLEDHVAEEGSAEWGVTFAKTPEQFRELVGMGDARPKIFVHCIEGAHSLEGKRTREIIRKARNETDKGSRPAPNDAGDPSYQVHIKDVLLTEQEKDIILTEVRSNLIEFKEMGLVSLGLGHYYPNVISDVVFPYPEHTLKGDIDRDRWPYLFRDLTRGLTVIGNIIVREALDMGIILDLSHVSPTARKDVYEILNEAQYRDRQGAVIATHTGAHKLNPLPYCLKDWEIRWLARRGGVIGVMLSNYFLTGYTDVKLGLRHVAAHIEHIVEAAAEEVGSQEAACKVVGIGTDFDGFSEPPDDLAFASQWPRLTQRLMAQYVEIVTDVEEADGTMSQKHSIVQKYSDESIKAMLGGNVYNLLYDNWGKM